MGIDEFNKKRSFFSFIPEHLQIQNKPEFDDFPLRVMFMKFKMQNGKTISGTALYDPDLLSYKQAGDKRSMEYRNIYGGDGRLIIEYNILKKSYYGEKFVNGKSVLKAMGPNWKIFFIHLTMAGLTKGERCMFEQVL
ncbi:hypothetical protein ACFL0L_00700 [Patescibacteria group bacterium]